MSKSTPRQIALGAFLIFTSLLATKLQAQTLTWNGADANWDINTSANWMGDALVFNNGNHVIFGNTGVTGITITGGGVSPASTTFGANAQDYTFTGGVILAGSLDVRGGTQILANLDNNPFAGATTIHAGGTLQVGTTSDTTTAIRNTSVTVKQGGVLHLFNSANATFDRYGDGQDLRLQGGTLLYTGHNLSFGNLSQETLGDLRFSAASTVDIQRPGGGGASRVFTSDLVREDRGILTLRGNSNFTVASNRIALNVASLDPAATHTKNGIPVANSVMFDPYVVGFTNAGTTPSFTRYALATGTNPTGTYNTFGTDVSYTTVNAGTLPANDGSLILDTATGGATIDITADWDLYAMRIQRTFSSTGGHTVTLRSGGMIFHNNNTGFDRTFGANIDLGTAEGVIYSHNANPASSNKNTITGNINGSNGLTVAGNVPLILTGANGYSGLTTVNGTTLAIGDGGSIANSSGVRLSGGKLDVSAANGGAGLTLAASQTLSGYGTVIGDLTMDGSLDIGSSPGTIAFEGNLVLGGTSVSTFEFGSKGFEPGSFDLAMGNGGDITYGGTLSLLFTGSGFTNGDSTTIFQNFANRSGTFATLNVSGLDEGYTAVFDPSSGMISVIPEPTTVLLVLFAGFAALVGYRRRH